MICSIYKSPKQEGMYLYVNKVESLSRVPDALLKHFGKPENTMTLLLSAQRKLAHVDVKNVLKAIESEGFFLQLPPVDEDTYMTDLHNKNTKF